MSTQTNFGQLIDQLRELRGLIDEVDGTEFGKLEKLFDRIAADTDKVIELADDIDKAIDWDALA